MPAWDAKLYLKFGNERTQPAVDLVSRVELAGPGRIIDIGCGPGNSTAILRQRWQQARVAGLDSSPEMIAAARQSQPQGEWILADVVPWLGAASRAYDLVFSNAVLQWIPDHARLVPGLFGLVAPGGALAFQIPMRAYSLSHQFILEVADDAEWAQRMSAAKQAFFQELPPFYYDLLAGQASKLDMWETEYYHVLPDHEAILQWVRGTAARPFLDALTAGAEQERFLGLLREKLRQGYPARADGKLLFPFRRLFVVAYCQG